MRRESFVGLEGNDTMGVVCVFQTDSFEPCLWIVGDMRIWRKKGGYIIYSRCSLWSLNMYMAN